MNKRDLKKTINYVCSELFAECVAASLYSGKANEDNTNALLTSILNIHNDYLKRISHSEPGLKAKVYYGHLIEDFNKSVAEIIDQISYNQ